jgi:hypothetical protein
LQVALPFSPNFLLIKDTAAHVKVQVEHRTIQQRNSHAQLSRQTAATVEIVFQSPAFFHDYSGEFRDRRYDKILGVEKCPIGRQGVLPGT